jgi:PAS domain S-box-containing protein
MSGSTKMIEETEEPVAVKILIAEDEVLVAEDLVSTLQDFGYQVVGMASTGEQAIQLAAESNPDVILMDIRLAGEVDGIEASGKIRAWLDVPVIFLTAYDEKDVLSRAKQALPYGYLTKPFSNRILRISIETALYKHAADKRVRESEEKYRLISENANIGILTATLDGVLLQANPAIARMAGYESVEEFLTIPTEQLYLNRIDRQRFLNELLEAGAMNNYEVLAQKKDGTPLWVSLNAVIQKDRSGNRASVLGIVEDISDRKKAEEALRASEAKYRELVQNANSIILRWNRKGAVTFLNEFGQNFFGYSAEEIVGRHVVGTIVPETETGGRDLRPLMQEICANPSRFEHNVNENMLRDGTRVWVEWTNKIIFDERSQLAEIFSVGTDITKRKEAEEALWEREQQYRTLVENMPDLIVRYDTDLRRIYVNPAWEEASGLSSEEVINVPVTDIPKVPSPVVPQYLEKLRRVMETGNSETIEFNWVNAHGVELYLEYVIVPEHDRYGKTVGALAVGHNLTERKRAEERLRLLDFALDHVREAAFLIDENAHLHFVNQESCRLLGYTRTELLGLGVSDIDPDFPQDRWLSHWSDLKSKGSFMFEGRHKTRDGRIFPVEINANYFEYGGQGYNLALVRDITERKQEENVRLARLRLMEFAATHTLEELLQATLDEVEALTGSLIGFYHFVDSDQRTLWLQSWSTRTLREMCTAEGKGLHYDVSEAGVWVDCVHERKPVIHNDYSTLPHRRGMPIGHAKVTRELVVPVFRSDRIVAILGVGNKPVDYDGSDIETVSLLADLAWDIVERKLVDENLRRSEAKFLDLYENAPCAYFSVGTDAFIRLCNRRAGELLGYSREELIGKPVLELYADQPEGKEKAEHIFKRFLAGESITDEELQMQKADGTPVWISLTVNGVRDSSGHLVESRSMALDISDRKRAEEAQHRLTRELRAISNCNQTLLRAVDEQTLIEDICRIICDEAGYRLAWVGYAENDDAKSIRPVAWAGFDSGYVADAKLSWADDTERGRGPAGRVIRSGEKIYVQDFATEPQMAPWRESALQRGYRSGLALPLKDESARVLGVLLIYHSEPNAITPAEIQLMEELAGDLAFGIVALRTRAERKRAQEALIESEAKYRRIVDTASEGIWMAGSDTLTAFVNAAMAEMIGYQVGEMIGQPLTGFMFEEDAPDYVRKMEALRQGLSEKYELRFRRKDGQTVWTLASACPIFDEEHHFKGAFAMFTDVTEPKKAEQERRANLQFFESMDRVNRAIQGTNDLEQMMSDVLDIVLSVFDCDRAFLLFPCDPEAATWTSPMERTKPEYPGVLASGLEMPMDPEVSQKLRVLLESDGAVKFGPHSDQPLPTEISVSFGIKSLLSMALHPKVGQPWEFGLQQCSYPRVWTQEEERLFQEIGRRVADALATLLTYRNLRESEAKLAEAERIAHIGYWERDFVADCVNLSTEAYRIFGLPLEERFPNLAEWHQRWLQLIHPEDRQKMAQAADDLLQRGSDYDVEYRAVRPDGEVRIVHAQGKVTRDESGRPRRAFGTMQDITELKKAEGAVRRANKDWEQTFDAIPDMVMVVDNRHRILRANKAMTDLLGLSEPELEGRFCYELVHNKGKPPAFCPHCVLLRDGKEHSEEVFEPKFGRSLDVRVSPLSDETGKTIGAVHVARDVTEQKNLQKQLLQAQKIESIGTLAGGIAHDFNNLLQIVFGYSEMLIFKKKPSDPEYEKLHAIRQAARDGSELTKRILAFSRKLEPDSRPVSLNNEISRIEKMLKRTIPRMIRIELHLADDLMTVNADPSQIEQILLNLTVNAQHAMPDGGLLTIETANATLDEDYSRTHLDVLPGNYVLLTVSDTGHGMDKAVLEHIFEPFYTTKEPGVGTGLGLAMVFGIVKSHRGHIFCYSEPGSGTTFKIYLPAIMKEIEQDTDTTREMPAFGNETVLLVDDEDSIREVAEQFLTQAGYKVLTATNGREALEVYRSKQDSIALILLDLIMPGLGGKQCLEELLEMNPTVKVIIASGYSVNGHTKDAIECGAKGFVSKPYGMRDLLTIVRRVLDAK